VRMSAFEKSKPMATGGRRPAGVRECGTYAHNTFETLLIESATTCAFSLFSPVHSFFCVLDAERLANCVPVHSSLLSTMLN
jgi:hypothetical protein